MNEETKKVHPVKNSTTTIFVFFLFSLQMKKEKTKTENLKSFILGWLFGFYGISTFVGYLMPNPSLYK